MTDDEIIEIRDSLLPSQGEQFDQLEFGRAIAAAEREACAYLCDQVFAKRDLQGRQKEADAAEFCATEIRKRYNASIHRRAALSPVRWNEKLEGGRMKRTDVVEHVLLMPMRIKTQWEGDKLIAVMPAWRLPTQGLLVEGDNIADALDKLEHRMRQYWGAPSNA